MIILEFTPTPMAIVQGDNKSKLKNILGKSNINVELCRVDEVYEDEGTVTLYLFDSNRFARHVPYCFPLYNAGYGIIFVPMKGAIGLATTDSNGSVRLLCFVAPNAVTTDGSLTSDISYLGKYNIPKISEGEILLKGAGDSFIYLDKQGSLTLSSSLFSYIELNNEMSEIDVENITITVNKVLKELIQNEYTPHLEIIKGKHDYHPIQSSDFSIELSYSMTLKENENIKFFIGIDSEGTIHMKKTKIVEYD